MGRFLEDVAGAQLMRPNVWPGSAPENRIEVGSLDGRGHSGHSLLLQGLNNCWEGVRQTLNVYFISLWGPQKPQYPSRLSSWGTCGRGSAHRGHDTPTSAQQVSCLTKTKGSTHHQHSQSHKLTHTSSWSSQAGTHMGVCVFHP